MRDRRGGGGKGAVGRFSFALPVVVEIDVEGLGAGEILVAILAHAPGVIARALQHGGQGSGARNVPARRTNAKQRAAGEHHGAARQTHGGSHGPHGVTVTERHAARDQLIEIRRIQFYGTERVQGIGAMIVGVDVENVRRAASDGQHEIGEPGQ